MHIFQVVSVVVGSFAARIFAENIACKAPSIVFITVPGPTITETASSAASTALLISTLNSTTASATSPLDKADFITTATATIYVTHTNVISVFHASASSWSTDHVQGPYYFSVSAGTTIWLDGKTPPSTDAFVTRTASFVVQPVPHSIESSKTDDKQTISTSTSTVILTDVLTKGFTETFSEPSVVPTIIKSFTGVGTNGWNATASSTGGALGGAGVSGSGSPILISYATNIGYSNSPISGPATFYLKDAKVDTRNASKHKRVRQVGTYVTATIDGVVVSWANNWFGNPSAAPSLVTRITTVAMISSASLSSFHSLSTPSTFYSLPSPSSKAAISSIPTLPKSPIPFGPPTVHHPTITVKSSMSTTSDLSTVLRSTSHANESSTMTAAQAPAPSQCSGKANFTINFDDLPTFGGAPNDTDYPPIFNPYHNLFWAQGFAYLPPPSDPFSPISPPQLAVFVVNSSANVHSNPGPPIAGDELIGEFGAGSRSVYNAFWFNAYSAYLGCYNIGPNDCIINVNGYTYSPGTEKSILTFRQTVKQPSCHRLTNCTLSKVTFTDDFRNLAGLQIIATVRGNPVTWFMDNLEVGWSNHSCAANLLRNSFPDSFP